MVSAETPSENTVCTPNLYTIHAGDTVIHSVIHWDLFYWPNFIRLPLKSVKMPLRRLSMLSASKIITVFNEYECCFVSKLSAKARFKYETMLWIFTDSFKL